MTMGIEVNVVQEGKKEAVQTPEADLEVVPLPLLTLPTLTLVPLEMLKTLSLTKPRIQRKWPEQSETTMKSIGGIWT